MKIMKLNGNIEESKRSSYSWVCGEQEYNLTYDKNGDLYGIETSSIDLNILDDIINNPWDYNFPATLDEYLELEK